MSDVCFAAIYKCPQCGSRHIKCWAETQAILSPVNNTWTRADYPALEDGIDVLLDTRRCECLECGKGGYLYQWEINDGS
jgi:hypothetical protein